MKSTFKAVVISVLSILIGGILCMPVSLYARNLGAMGETYPIQEVDFLEFIQNRAALAEQNGLLTQLQSDMQKYAASYRDRPLPVEDIGHTLNPKTWLFDPSIVLDHDIKSAQGNIIAVKGARINPFTYVSLHHTLIFYDADEKKEREWITQLDKKLKGQDKLVLVKGSLITEEKRLGKPVYFDQLGRLVKRFGIKQVPAFIQQEGNLLRIKEVKP